MKIFLDTADYTVLDRLAKTGLIDGVTTNPSHFARVGGNPLEVLTRISALLPTAEISVEITERSPEDVERQARALAKLGPTIIVKIPCFPHYVPVIRALVQDRIAINITLVFSLVQAFMMAKLSVRYISPFIGRLEDIDGNGLKLIRDIRFMLDTYNFSSQLLAASLRTIRHLHAVIEEGADIVTLPVELFERALEHPLTDKGMALFEADWQKLGIKQFP